MPNPKSGWKVNASYGPGACATTPGGLPSTDKQPAWWNNAPIESGSRWANTYWNCCCHDKSDFANADASPK
jgi:hypothetical protein